MSKRVWYELYIVDNNTDKRYVIDTYCNIEDAYYTRDIILEGRDIYYVFGNEVEADESNTHIDKITQLYDNDIHAWLEPEETEVI